MGISKSKIGFFPGNWDLLHVGHIRALKEAKKYCDFLWVGLKENNDDKLEKNQSIMSWKERAEVLQSIEYVNGLVTYKTEKELYKFDRWFPGVRFMGADHKGRKHHLIKAKIVYISRKHSYSTRNLRQKIWEIENKKR